MVKRDYISVKKTPKSFRHMIDFQTNTNFKKKSSQLIKSYNYRIELIKDTANDVYDDEHSEMRTKLGSMIVLED
ncbi:8216_t:CDS:2 [Cetraspora pellucida]|uniref:8216_t:CDS:1 n=1 Tax=Cetraspora pellucida TaxID=1433469 RepID=A0A9N9BY08_9GLOM|nr:8216_t:CDS:2 [Cetraspora pellucida]